jgi:hypothetical protein
MCARWLTRSGDRTRLEVAVVKDATAAPRHPVIGDGYIAAVINYGFLANAVLTTNETVKAMR